MTDSPALEAAAKAMAEYAGETEASFVPFHLDEKFKAGLAAFISASATDTAALRAFLDEAARYFEKRDTGGEDRAHWANVYNAENCRKAAEALATLEAKSAGLERERDALLASFKSHIDGRDLLDELCPQGWHHCDIVVRINGEDRHFEGDWLKNVWYARKEITNGR